jgi:hypothetical protein
MAIGVNSSVSRADLAATTATTTITKPTGTTGTGVLVVVFGTDQSGTPGSITPPAGWTAIFTNVLVTVGSTGVRLSGYWALGSVANLGFTNSTTGDQQGWVCREYTGVDNANPIDAADNTGTGHNTGSASLTVNSVTVATANAWELIAFASWLGGTNSATGFTAAQNVATPPATNADATLLHNPTPKGTGATGTVAVTSSAAASGQILIGVPFALRDSGAPPVPAVSLLASLFTTTGGTSMATASATPSGNNLLVAVCAVTGSVATDWAVTDSLGGAWTKIAASRAQKGTNVDEMEVWVRNALTSSALTVTYSHVSGSATGGGLVVLQATNMTRTGASAVRGAGVQSNQASGTAPAPVLPATTLTANPTLWAVFNATALASTPLTDPANWTRRANLSYATPTTGIQVATRDSGFAGTTITGGSNSGSAYSSLGVELDASAAAVTGNASATLGALAGAAGATVAVTGNATATLGTLSGQASGSAGGGSTGNASATLDPLAGQAAATVRNPPTANAAAVLGPLAAQTSVAVAVRGQAAATLGGLAGATAATVRVTGSAAPALGPLVGSAAAAVAVKGNAAPALGGLTAAAAGAVAVRGDSSATLGPLIGLATGSVISGRVASAGATLGPLAGAATATVAVLGQAATTFGGLSVSAAGTVAVRGTAAGSLDALQGAASAAVAVRGQAAAVLGGLAGSAAGHVVGLSGPVGNAAATLGPLTGQAAARVADVARVRWRDHGRAKEQRWRTPS